MTNNFIDTPHQATFKTTLLNPATADPITPSLTNQARTNLTHLSLTNPRAYHRSKLFTANTGINPLLTAATALFAYLTNLRTMATCEDIPKLYQELQHEIKAFEAQAQTLGYRSDSILVARYMLCSMFDEVILSTKWGQQSQWYQHKLLHLFHNEDWGGERFFVILKRLNADPGIHIDILELAYLCLSLGFAGKYKFIEQGHYELEQITTQLYQCIRWQRGDIKKELIIIEETKTHPATTLVKVSSPTMPLWLLGTLTATCIATFYIGFNFLLGYAATPLYQQLNTFL